MPALDPLLFYYPKGYAAIGSILVPDTMEGAEREYPHELHCNANRMKPIGCDMCSCKYGRLIKRREHSSKDGE